MKCSTLAIYFGIYFIAVESINTLLGKHMLLPKLALCYFHSCITQRNSLLCGSALLRVESASNQDLACRGDSHAGEEKLENEMNMNLQIEQYVVVLLFVSFKYHCYLLNMEKM